MDLPTYTNIWRIEKRLYKIYDFRLPIPLPIGQIVVFVAVTVPYVTTLVAAGLPIDHRLFWLYVLPPLVATWLATRPVLENKRLPELLASQVRYVAEPRTWCRLMAAGEADEILIVGRVWHRKSPVARAAAPARAAARRARAASARVHAPAPAWAPAPARVQASASAEATAPAHVRVRAVAEAPVPTQVRAASPAQRPVQARAEAPAPARAPVLRRSPIRVSPVPPLRAAGVAFPAAPGPGAQSVTAALAASAFSAEAAVPDNAAPGRTAGPGTGAPAPAEPDGAMPARDEPDMPSPGTGAAEAPAAARHELRSPALRRAAAGQPFMRSGALEVAHTEGPADGSGTGLPSPEGGGQPDEHDPAGAVDVGDATPTAAGGAAPAANLPPGAPSPGSRSRRMPKHAAARPEAPAERAAPMAAGSAPAPAAGSAPELTEHGRPPAPLTQRAPAPARRGGPAPVTQNAQPAPARDATRSVERVVRRARDDRGSGWHRRAKVVVGGLGPGRVEPEEREKARCRLALPGPRRIVILGCTSGAGQTATALMLGQLMASLRAEPVAAVDLNPGDRSLSRQLRARPIATVGGLLADAMPGAVASRGLPVSSEPVLEVIASGEDRVAVHGLDEHDYRQLAEMLGARYELTLVDPAAPTVARVLHIADQLVLVAPASADAPRAVAMTYEWLDSHGHTELAARAVAVINGVSKRSMADVVQAESVAHGRSRAIVRVPWDDQLDGDRGPVPGPRTLRPQTRQAYTAVAGVTLAGLAAAPGGLEVSRSR